MQKETRSIATVVEARGTCSAGHVSAARRLCAALVAAAALLASCSSSRGAGVSRLASEYRGRVVVIVNGDDLGVETNFTDATIDAYRRGMIGSASIISPGPDADRTLSIVKAAGLPVGVHLTLTGDWKPLTAGPSLRNPAGTMWSTSAEAAAHVNPGEAAAEWEAQISRVLDAGITISHLDSHMGAYFLSASLFKEALALAVKYKVPMISPPVAEVVGRKEERLFPLSSYTGIYTLSAGVAETAENRAQAYWRLLAGLAPGVHYLYSHHAQLPPDGKISGDMDIRLDDYAFWTAPETRKRLQEMGIVMIGCAPLLKDFQEALKGL